MTEAWRLKMTSWFDQLAESCELSQETLSIATNYLDRYLSVESCCSQRFQLASVAAIFLASKVEESRPFKTTDFETLSDGAFTPVHVRFMELELLCTLRWRLHPPTVQSFIHLLCVLVDDSMDQDAVADAALRFAQQSRPRIQFVQYPPSMIAVASILCALKTLDVDACIVADWMNTVNECCEFCYSSLPRASDLVTRCGLMLIHIDRQLNGDTNFAYREEDRELEQLTHYAMNRSRDWRKHSSSPTDVMAVDDDDACAAPPPRAAAAATTSSDHVVDACGSSAPTWCY